MDNIRLSSRAVAPLLACVPRRHAVEGCAKRHLMSTVRKRFSAASVTATVNRVIRGCVQCRGGIPLMRRYPMTLLSKCAGAARWWKLGDFWTDYFGPPKVSCGERTVQMRNYVHNVLSHATWNCSSDEWRFIHTAAAATHEGVWCSV